MSEPALLEVRDLHVRFTVRAGEVHAVRGVDLTVNRGEVAAIVGESGSGKSATMLAALGLLDANATATGSVKLDGIELIGAPEGVLRRVRGGRIGMIFQDPMTSLNPVMPVGRQIAEAIVEHQRVSPKQAEKRAIELLETVSIPEAARRARGYAHELSGGMRQRAMIAIALANDPDIVIADEPTTALDVTVQAQILDVLRSLQESRQLTVLLITHDLGVVAGLSDRVHVMYAGEVVESAPAVDAFHRPQHPYTSALLESLPRLDRPERELIPIGGAPPALLNDPAGCAFAPRCRYAIESSRTIHPTQHDLGPTSVVCDVLPMKQAIAEKEPS
jgi:oligopeptide/dipeptide ABC transporter ATP-binding protein